MIKRYNAFHKDPDFRPGIPPGQVKATQHPNAANFPDVGMTLPSYSPDITRKAPLKMTRLQKLRSKITRKRLIIGVSTILIVLIGWLGWKFIYDFSKAFGGSIFGLFSHTRLKGEDVGRVNILLAGNSADDVGHSGGTLTDSIMLVSLDTRHNRAYLLSIPRDLWVNIPGYGYHKINEAYVYGQAAGFHKQGYPKGGMGLLEEAVSEDFQIPINYYALVDYHAMKEAVNAVGGIDIKIKSSDPRGLYDPSIDWSTHGPLVNLSNGWHHLNGEQALDLARARGDAYGSYGFAESDFTRTASQRQMLIALKKKVTSFSVLANPATLSKLADALGRNVRTDFKTNELQRLYELSKQIQGSSIKSLSLNDANGKDLLTSYQSPYGESALIPAAGMNDFSQIDMYLKRLFSNDPVVRENASVVVLNGTNTSGLAARASKKLEAKGVDVTTTADAPRLYSTTMIIDNSSHHKPATKRMLKNMYGDNITTDNPYSALYNVDFIIILGASQVP